MKSLGLQKLVRTIFSDSQTRQEFIKDPDTVLSGYNLTEREKTVVLKRYGKLGLVTDSGQLESIITTLDFWV